MECLEEKKQEWCFRLDQEKRFSDCSFFCTLTYEDEFLTYADDQPCLYKRDVQLFLKRLRKSIAPDKIKYYIVGEYGDQWRPITPLGRPHYHALIFYRGSLDWFKLSLIIKDAWILGIAQVLPVLGAQGYVTKYILKFDKRPHLVKPFSMISHGLGIDYLSDAMVAYHRRNLINFAMKPGGYRVSLPRYYKDKIFNQAQKLVMKKRADMYRKDIELLKMRQIDMMCDLGLNPFKNQVENYKLRVYNSIKLYRQKKKL